MTTQGTDRNLGDPPDCCGVTQLFKAQSERGEALEMIGRKSD